MSLKDTLAQCRASNDYSALVGAVPYARLLGIGCIKIGDDVVFTLPALQDNIGNPTLPAIHGGVLGGFIEHAAILQVIMAMDEPRFPKVVDLSLDYLSAGHYRDSFAEARIMRMGRRLANVSVLVWQTSKDEPVASARAHLLLN
ncbi:MAG TPA: PaaI family thioesterase [Dongiaceae bacterium]|nr:PaaI family thioesterase [Dongiaceae bacterium]